jgi:light-regulated signal transduction histidine kinase (bacteriophytochrome)
MHEAHPCPVREQDRKDGTTGVRDEELHCRVLLESLLKSEDQLRQLNTELQLRLDERDMDLDSLSSSVSFELRSPLRVILAYAQLVLEDHGDQLPEDGQQMLRGIRKAGLRMGGMFDDLLRLMKLGRRTPRYGTIDTNRLVRGVLAELMRGRNEGAVDLQIGELSPCRADEAMLRLVWMSLASNALKYSRGRCPAVIEISHGTDGTYCIRDNGVGFDMRYADRLFIVFQRLHSTAEFEGEGMGLAVAERVVRRHGGRIWADSTLGSGSTFWFTLGASGGSIPTAADPTDGGID